MIKRSIDTILVLGLALFQTSCWKDPEDKNERRTVPTTNETEGPEPSPPAEAEPPPFDAQELASFHELLDHQWQIPDCLGIEGERSTRIRSDYSRKDQVLWSIEVFKDADCTDLFFSAVTQADYALTGRLEAERAYQIDYKVRRTVVTAGTLKARDKFLLRGVKFCGYNDWDSGVERDVTGRTCKLGNTADARTIDLPPAGTILYDIVRVSETELQTGLSRKEIEQAGTEDQRLGTSPKTRPNSFNETLVRLDAR